MMMNIKARIHLINYIHFSDKGWMINDFVAMMNYK